MFCQLVGAVFLILFALVSNVSPGLAESLLGTLETLAMVIGCAATN